jgi:hypothetical protein
MAKRALRPGEHGVVIGQHGAGAAVDARRAGDEAVGRGARDQVVQIAAKPLRGDREAAVFDERPRVDQILDVSRAVRPLAACLRSTASGRAASSVSARRLNNSA